MPSHTKEYSFRANSMANATLSATAFEIAIRLESGEAHLVSLYATSRTNVTSWIRLGVGTVLTTGSSGDTTDTLTRVLAEGYMRGAVPVGGFTTQPTGPPTESTISWDGDHVLLREPEYIAHFIRMTFWTQMGSTVTFEVRARVRYDE